ncbi:PTS sucrose transporter subunit IIABC [Peribacillus loiseleuriae]|uniref:PTS sucrose transporter subunit IIABC n=2 Tax=Peribacillus loiseleuriae TaxID=1679170 RepID=A0A0K9H0D7_9BACI|nr:PTS sucrose transporter subunit IIABC [Peribacillus loiseleuriae]
MAAQGIEEGLKKRKITNVKVKAGRIDDIERHKDDLAVLVSTMKIKQEYSFPVFNAVAFITGDEDGQEQIISEVVNILK